MALRCRGGQACPCRRFVNKTCALRMGHDGGQTVLDPIDALLSHPGTATLGCYQRLFLYVNSSRDSRLTMEA